MKLWLWIYMITSVSALAADTSTILPTAIARTSSPKSAITAPPAYHAELFKRAALATCGFISGNSASPVTCDTGFNCATTAHAALGNAFACCDSIQCQNDWGLCISYGAQYNCNSENLAPSACSGIWGSILSCSSDAPNCYRYARSASRGAYITYYSWACGQTSSDLLVLLTATNGPQAAMTTQAFAAYTSQSYAYGSGTYNNPSSSTNTGGKSGLSTRAIVIIVLIGGAALFAILVVGVILCQKSRKNKRIAAAQSNFNAQQQQQQQQAPPSTAPPPAYPAMSTNPSTPMQNASPYAPPPGPPPAWNNGYPQVNEMAAKPGDPGTMTTVQEMNAPVRPLYEMPGGYMPPAGAPPEHIGR